MAGPDGESDVRQGGGLNTTLAISWSSLRRYEACRQKQYRYQRGETGSPPFIRDYLPGTIADRLQREWLSLPDPEPGWMVAHVDDMVERFTNPVRAEEDYREFRWKGDPAKDRRDIVGFVTNVVIKLEPVLLKLVVPYDYDVEHSFKVITGIPYLDDRIVGIQLRGGIDIVVRMPNGEFVLYDLKATTREAYINTTLGQGTFYDIAWTHYYGVQPVRFGFITPALDQQVYWADIDDDDRRVMVSRIIAYAHGMWRGDWTPKTDDSGCNVCEARHVCTKFALHLVTDDLGKRRVRFEDAVNRRRQAVSTDDGTDRGTDADQGPAGRAGEAAGTS